MSHQNLPDSAFGSVPRCGIDPLHSPDAIARVARAALSADETHAIILVDEDLVGHLIIATDSDVDSLLPLIAEADSGITRLVVAERIAAQSSITQVEYLRSSARTYGLHVVDVVVFDDTTATSQVAADRRTVADNRSPEFRK